MGNFVFEGGVGLLSAPPTPGSCWPVWEPEESWKSPPPKTAWHRWKCRGFGVQGLWAGILLWLSLACTLRSVMSPGNPISSVVKLSYCSLTLHFWGELYDTVSTGSRCWFLSWTFEKHSLSWSQWHLPSTVSLLSATMTLAARLSTHQKPITKESVWKHRCLVSLLRSA